MKYLVSFKNDDGCELGGETYSNLRYAVKTALAHARLGWGVEILIEDKDDEGEWICIKKYAPWAKKSGAVK